MLYHLIEVVRGDIRNFSSHFLEQVKGSIGIPPNHGRCMVQIRLRSIGGGRTPNYLDFEGTYQTLPYQKERIMSEMSEWDSSLKALVSTSANRKPEYIFQRTIVQLFGVRRVP